MQFLDEFRKQNLASLIQNKITYRQCPIKTESDSWAAAGGVVNIWPINDRILLTLMHRIILPLADCISFGIMLFPING